MHSHTRLLFKGASRKTNDESLGETEERNWEDADDPPDALTLERIALICAPAELPEID